MKLGSREFLGSVITNMNTKLRISKWRVQYGGSKWKKVSIQHDRSGTDRLCTRTIEHRIDWTRHDSTPARLCTNRFCKNDMAPARLCTNRLCKNDVAPARLCTNRFCKNNSAPARFCTNRLCKNDSAQARLCTNRLWKNNSAPVRLCTVTTVHQWWSILLRQRNIFRTNWNFHGYE